MILLLKSDSSRVRFFAAQALGRIKAENSIDAILTMIEENADEDIYLRHAGVLALTRIGNEAILANLSNNENRSLKLAAILALRRLKSKEISKFLTDSDEYLVAETARAINDDTSIKDALPQLAALLKDVKFSSEPLMRRAINAALRVGGEEQLNDLIAYAENESVPAILRGEALAALSTWSSPSVMDRVDGRHRGEVSRPIESIQNKVSSRISNLLNTEDSDVLVGSLKLLAALQLKGHEGRLEQILDSHNAPMARSEALNTLGAINSEKLAQAMQKGMADDNELVRETAVRLIAELDFEKEKIPAIVNPIFKKGGIREQQAVLEVLAEMPVQKSEAVLYNLMKKANRGQLEEAVLLDLIEAVKNQDSENLNNQLALLQEKGYGSDAYTETLYGGSWWAGQSVFVSNSTAQCVRCHALKGSGGKVGPPMDNIGAILTREQILESLIEPSKRIAPGYGSVNLVLTNGQEVTGLLEEETEEGLVLRTAEAEPLRVPHSRIKSRKNLPSGMPPMGKMISKRELRNLIEYLSSLKGV